MRRPSDLKIFSSDWTPFLLLIAAGFRFVNLSFGELQQWDESLYAIRTLSVLHFGEFLDQSPHMVGGFYYAAHPPLYVWISSAFAFLFGEQCWVFRFPSALAGGASVLLLFRIAKKILSRQAALFAALFLAFQPLVTFYSRQGQLDVLLMFFMLLSVYLMFLYADTGKPRFIYLGSGTIAAALLTKFLFALGLYAGVGILFIVRWKNIGERISTKRLARFALYTGIISLPCWLAWSLYFAAQNGDGNPLFLLSGMTPIGQTMLGGEGTDKGLGFFYYLNQLIVQLSFLFPAAMLGLYHAVRTRTNAILLYSALTFLSYLLVIELFQSKFLVYLLPMFPFIIMIGVEEFLSLTRADARLQAWIAVTSFACTLWSLSETMRRAVKSVFSEIVHGKFMVEERTLLIGGAIFVFMGAMILIRILSKRRKLDVLFQPTVLVMAILALAFSTMAQTFFVQPDACNDGASAIADEIQQHKAGKIFFIGNGINPQLTFYLRGEDIGWYDHTSRTYERLEPRTLGVDSIRERINNEVAGGGTTFVVVEKDEIAAGIYSSSEQVVPANAVRMKETARYILLRLPGK